MKKIACFCGGSPNLAADDEIAAKQLGKEIANAGFGLVYGGGKHGMMRALGHSYISAGGVELTAIITKHFFDKGCIDDIAHKIVFASCLMDRKKSFIDLSEAFVILFGGIGTLDELFTVTAMQQIGELAKPICIFDPNFKYKHIKNYFEFLHRDGVISNVDLKRFDIITDYSKVLECLFELTIR